MTSDWIATVRHSETQQERGLLPHDQADRQLFPHRGFLHQSLFPHRGFFCSTGFFPRGFCWSSTGLSPLGFYCRCRDRRVGSRQVSHPNGNSVTCEGRQRGHVSSPCVCAFLYFILLAWVQPLMQQPPSRSLTYWLNGPRLCL